MNNKKKFFYIVAFLSLVIVLGACSDKDTVKNAPSNEEVQSEFGFRSFNLEVDTMKQKDAVEASFDLDVSETEAEYTDKLKDIKLSGDEAYTKLEPIFKDLGLTKDMTREEVIESVSKAFDIEDFAEFELEIEFPDGTEQEYSELK